MKNIYNDLKILLSKDIYKLYLLLFGSLLSTLFEVVSIGSIPVFVMLITDIDLFLSKISQNYNLEFISNLNHFKVILFGAITLMFVFLIKNLYLFLILFYQGKVMMNLRTKTSCQIFNHYISLSYEKVINKNPAILIRTIESDISNTFLFMQSILMLTRESLILISLFLLLIFADPIIFLISITILGVPVLIFYYFYKNKLKIKGKLLQLEMGKKLKTINHSLGSFKELKIMRRENFFLSSFQKIVLNSEKLNFFSYIVTSTPRLFLEITALFAVVIGSVTLYAIGNNTESIIPLISLFAVTVVRLIPALNVITASLATLRFKRPSFDLIISEIKEMKQNINIKNKNGFVYEKKINEFKFNNEIYIKNVSFSYFDTTKTAVKYLNLKIKKGSSIGIIGRSGAGKSTLVDLILGLLDPKNGEIYIDNFKLDGVRSNWQSQIGYIPQDIYLLDDTIKNNISFGIKNEEIDNSLIEKAVKIAQLENFINLLPDKLETVVGNRGIKISGGEKQRIGIARALYNKPKILIFDEATSSLDIDNENKILGEIYRGIRDKTLIIISHRNNTVKYCDSIYVMEEGEIIDQGPYKKIMERHQYLREKKISP